MLLVLLNCASPEASPARASATPPAPADGSTRELLAFPEASALVALDGGALLVAGDEDNVLFFVAEDRRVTELALPPEVLSLLTSKDGKPPAEIDFEGMTLATVDAAGTLTPVVVIMGSHANKKVYKPKDLEEPAERSPNRHLVFAIRVPSPGDTTTTLVGTPFSGLTSLLSRPPPGRPAPLPSDVGDRAPNAGGIDIEGLAFGDGQLWFGLRSPIEGGMAVVAGAPVTLLMGEVPEALSSWDPIDLGGRGVRSIERAADGTFVIVGGHVPRCAVEGDTLVDTAPSTDFALYTWSRPEVPVRLDLVYAPGVRPEGVALTPEAWWFASDDASSPAGAPCAKKEKGQEKAKSSTLVRVPPLWPR